MIDPIDAELAFITAGIVAAIRKQAPWVDGWKVFPVVAFVAVALSYAARPVLSFVPLLHAGIIAIGAVIGVSLLQQVARKAAASITTRPTTVLPSLPPPPPMPPVTVDQDAITTPKDAA